MMAGAGLWVGGRMEFRLLGAVHASVDGRVVNLGVRQQRFILAVLPLEVNALVTTDRLIDLTRPDDPPARRARSFTPS